MAKLWPPSGGLYDAPRVEPFRAVLPPARRRVLRQVPAAGEDRDRRHGRGLQRALHLDRRLSEAGRAEADPPAPLHRRRVRLAVHRRGQADGDAEPQQHRPGLRLRPDREQLLHRDGVRGRQGHDAGAHQAEQAPSDGAARGRLLHHGPDPQGPRVRPHAPRQGRHLARHRPPRRLPAQHPGLLRRRGEDHRLRHREGPHQGQPDPPGRGARQVRVHVAGAGPRQRGRRPQRRLLRGNHAL